ncbi:phosphoribosylanthranilate isomerase [Luteolibacter sp. SL250]|uniref:phosphoribosylanthranilate isomerase n=1 Tax=Luteolibacter sp. SL250 TaxID=2995170 RepID=UPI002270ACA1|nr:phosphoribosylanthranilate isomerase [Luteolibacter sp. SL250]WAC21247.1 phosphoribosylanthranilate isomerase [Luteolibacter sp. SL250]
MTLERFLDSDHVSLKICGVTTRADAQRLVDMGVPALGANFWPQSKRHLPPEDASFLRDFAGRILRVGVFVNQPDELAIRLFEEGIIDVVQLHGDEKPADAAPYQAAGIPFIKAIGVKTLSDLSRAAEFGASAILLDAHAPGVYGGTGEVFDWNVANSFKKDHPELPIILAGGIIPGNAALAADTVAPAALDVASGAEISPGVKDFDKVAQLLSALQD